MVLQEVSTRELAERSPMQPSKQLNGTWKRTPRKECEVLIAKGGVELQYELHKAIKDTIEDKQADVMLDISARTLNYVGT